MADIFFGVDKGGQSVADVTVSTSTTGRDIELVVDDTNLPQADGASKNHIRRGINAILEKLLEYEY